MAQDVVAALERGVLWPGIDVPPRVVEALVVRGFHRQHPGMDRSHSKRQTRRTPRGCERVATRLVLEYRTSGCEFHVRAHEPADLNDALEDVRFASEFAQRRRLITHARRTGLQYFEKVRRRRTHCVTGSFGSPSTRSPRMLRWTSLVPPPMVSAAA